MPEIDLDARSWLSILSVTWYCIAVVSTVIGGYLYLRRERKDGLIALCFGIVLLGALTVFVLRYLGIL